MTKSPPIRCRVSSSASGKVAKPSAALEARLGRPGADDFIAAPLWASAPAESSPFTRQSGQALVADLTREQGNGLLTRLAAQLVELAVILAGLPVRLAALAAGGDGPGEKANGIGGGAAKASLPDGVGLVQVQAARGLLVHRVAIQAGRVADYRILAPTEWNFHPQGAAALDRGGRAGTGERPTALHPWLATRRSSRAAAVSVAAAQWPSSGGVGVAWSQSGGTWPSTCAVATSARAARAPAAAARSGRRSGLPSASGSPPAAKAERS